MQTDNRQNKINFLVRNGYSQEVIDFACQENLRYDKKYKALPWVARERAKQILDVDKVNFVLDWFRLAEAVDITTLNFEEAWKESEEWHSTLGTDKLEIKRLKQIPLDMDKVVAEIDGYYIVVLDSAEELNREGKLMKHCVSESFLNITGYNVEKIVYSIRDKNNRPLVTFTINFLEYNFVELKAVSSKSNTRPEMKYYRVILKWLELENITSLKFEIIIRNQDDIDFLSTLSASNISLHLTVNLENIQTIPVEICQLINLEVLDLSFNSLTHIPSDIGQLKQLRILDLCGNMVTKLPAEIFQLTQLEKLYLAGNNISEFPFVITELKALKELNLVNNKLKKIPSEIAQLTQLEVLDLSSNPFTHISSHVSQLKQLRTLSLKDNKLTKIPAEIFQLAQLEILELSCNNLTKLPAEICQLKKLRLLVLSGNKLAEIPAEIGQLTQLKKLVLSHNKLAIIPMEIGQLQQLQSLYLNDNKLIQLPKELGNLTLLRWLEIDNNCLTEIPIELDRLENIHELDLSNNEFTEITPNILKMRNIERFDLRGNKNLRINNFDPLQHIPSIIVDQEQMGVHADIPENIFIFEKDNDGIPI